MKSEEQLKREFIRKNSLTVEAYINFFKERGIDITDEKEDCYDCINHVCDGSCQGASDCPIAMEFWTGEEATPYKMRRHNVESQLARENWREVDTEKIKQLIDKLLKG